MELSAGAAWALAAGVAALVVALAAAALHARRRVAAHDRRLAAVTARLERPGARPRQDRDSLGRLEQLAESSVLRSVDAEAARARLAGALASLGTGVVVCDEAGAVVLRNGPAGVVDELPGAAELVDGALAEARAGGRPLRELEDTGPPPRKLAVAAHPLDDGARPLGAVALVEDRSDARRLDVARQELLADLTAVLRGPVTAVEALAATVAGALRGGADGTPPDPEVAGRLASRLAGEARRARRLIDDVAELSQLDAGVPPPAAPVRVADLVAEALEGAARAARSAGVALSAPAPAGAPTVLGARRPLASALRHLVEGAVGQAPPGSTVTVSVAADPSGEWVAVGVADDGHPPAPGQPEPAGAGLKLAIAARTAAGYGGQVVVEPGAGHGSVRTLRLPAGPGRST